MPIQTTSNHSTKQTPLISRRLLGCVAALCLSPWTASAFTTVESVVNAALVSHPDVQGARARAKAAEHTITQARAGYFPTVSFSATGAREWSKSPAVAARRPNSDNITLNREEYRLNLDQILFTGGRVFGEVKQSQYNTSTALHELDSVRQDIALRAVEAYLNVMRQRELVNLAKKNIETHEETARKVAKRVNRGASRRVEGQLATARLALSRTRKERFDAELAVANARYRAVTQLTPAHDMVLPQAPVGVLPKNEAAAISWALHNSPRVLAAHSNILANRAAVTIARSNFFPTVIGRLSASDADNLDGIQGPPRNQDAMASVILNYDFFSGFRDVGAVREAQALVKDATHNLETFQLDITENIKSAWATYESSLEQVYIFQQYAIASQKVVDDYEQHFILGERQLFNVLDAENETFSARVSLTNARFDSLINLYRVFAAMGNLTDILTNNQQDKVDDAMVK